MELENQKEDVMLSPGSGGPYVKPFSLKELDKLIKDLLMTDLVIKPTDEYPRLKAELIALLEPVVVSRVQNGDKEQKQRITDAYAKFREMTFPDQYQFGVDRSDLVDKFFACLSLEQLHELNAGMITGVNTSFPGAASDQEKIDQSPLLSLLADPSTYKPENKDLLLMLEEIVLQAEPFPGDPEKTNKEEFLRIANSLIQKNKGADFNAHTDVQNYQTARGIGSADEKEPLRGKLYYLTILYNARRGKLPEGRGWSILAGIITATDAWKGLGVFMAPWLLRNKNVKLSQISLYEVQRLKTWGGHFYGLEFAQGANADLELNLDNGLLKVDADTLPVDALNYISPNMTVRTDNGSFDGVHLNMKWPTTKKNRKGEEVNTKRNDLVTAEIKLDHATAFFNNLRYISRGASGESTISMSKITVSGLTATGLYRKNRAKAFRSGYGVMMEMSYGMMDMIYMLTYAVLAAIDQMMYTGEKYSEDSLEGFKEYVLKTLQGKAGLQISFAELQIDNLFHSDYGLIREIKMGASTISLKSSKEKKNSTFFPKNGPYSEMNNILNTIAENKLQQEQDSLIVQIRKLEQEKSRLTGKIAGKTPKKSQRKSAGRKIDRWENDIVEINKQLKDLYAKLALLVKDNKYALVFETQEEVQLNDAAIVEKQLKSIDAISGLLNEYGVKNLKGLDDIHFPKGFSLTSTLGMESVVEDNIEKVEGTISNTTFNLPEFLFPKLFAESFSIDMSSFWLHGSPVTIWDFRGKAKFRWTDVSEAKENEEGDVISDLIIEELELTDATVLVNSLVIEDCTVPERSIALTGPTFIEGFYMKFPYAAEGKFESFILGCSQITTSDVSAFQLLDKKEKEDSKSTLSFWFKEKKGAEIVLNGFEMGVRKSVLVEEPKDALKGVRKEESYYKLNTATFTDVGIDNASITTDLTHFSCVITDHVEVTRKEDQKTEDPTGVRERDFVISFGMNSIDIPKVNLENDKFRLAFAGYDQTVEEMKANIARLKGIIKKTEQANTEKTSKANALAHYRYILQLYNRAMTQVAEGHKATLKNIDADIRMKMYYPGEGKPSEFRMLNIDCLYIGSVEATNLSFTIKKDDALPIYLMGDNQLYGLKISDAFYNGLTEEINLQPGGIISGSKVAIAQLISSTVGLDKFGTGVFSLERLADNAGYTYSIEDVIGRYSINTSIGNEKFQMTGNQQDKVDLDGGFNFDKNTGLFTGTLTATGNLYIPNIVYDKLLVEAQGGYIRLEHLTADVAAQFSPEDENGDRELLTVTFNSLHADKLGLLSARIKYNEYDVVTSDTEENFINDITFENVVYDLRKEKLEAFTGKITTGSLDLSNIDKTQGIPYLNLLNGGLKATSVLFERSKHGKLDIAVTGPELFAQQLLLNMSGKKINIDAVINAAAPLFSAGEITYTNRKDNEEGHFIEIKKPVFNQIIAEGDVILPLDGRDSANIRIEELKLYGAATGTVKVTVTDEDIIIDALTSEFTIENLDIRTPDLDKLMSAKPETESYYQKKLEEEIAKIMVPGLDGKDRPLTMEEYYSMVTKDVSRQLMDSYIQKQYEQNKPDYQGGLGTGVATKERIESSPYFYKEQYTEPVKELTEAEKLLQKVYAVENNVSAMSRGRDYLEQETNFNFLDHLIEGKVSINIFGSDVPLELVRIKNGLPINISPDQLTKLPADPDAEAKSGKAYSTFVNVPKFIHDLTTTMSENIEWGSWLNSVAGTDETHTGIQENQLRLLTEGVWTRYSATLLTNITSDNLKVVKSRHGLLNVVAEHVEGNIDEKAIEDVIGNSGNHLQYDLYARLSSLMNSIMYHQDPASIAGTPSGQEEKENPKKFHDLGVFDAENRIVRHLIQLLHANMNPKLVISGAKIDLRNKTQAQKGMLGFIKQGEGDAPLQTDLTVSLNQESRVDDYNIFHYHFFRRELGPDLLLKNFNLPPFTIGEKSGDVSDLEARNLVFSCNGIQFDELHLQKQQLDLPETQANYMDKAANSVSKKAFLKGKNVKIKGFKITGPNKKGK